MKFRSNFSVLKPARLRWNSKGYYWKIYIMETTELYPNHHIYYIYKSNRKEMLDELIILCSSVKYYIDLFLRPPAGVMYYAYIRNRDGAYTLVVHFSCIYYEDYIAELRRSDAGSIYFGSYEFSRSTYFSRTQKADISMFSGSDVIQIINRRISNWTYNVEGIHGEIVGTTVTIYVTLSVTAYGVKIFQRTFMSTFEDHKNFDMGSHYKMAVSFAQVKWLDIFLIVKRNDRYFLCVRDEYISAIPVETRARIVDVPNEIVSPEYEFISALVNILKEQRQAKMEEIEQYENGKEGDMYGKYIVATDLSKRTEK